MSYEKLNLVNGEKFSAEHVSHIEDGIVQNALDAEAQINQIKGDLNYFGVAEEVDFSDEVEGIYIGKDEAEHLSDYYNCKKNITLNKGDKIILVASGYQTVISMIAKQTMNGKYITLVNSIDSAEHEYEYVATDNITVTVSYNKSTTHKAKIIKNAESLIDTKLEETKQIISEISEYVTPKNLYNPIGLTADKLLNADGTLTEQSGYSVTDFLDVSDEYAKLVFARNNSYGQSSTRTMVAVNAVSVIFYYADNTILETHIAMWASEVEIPQGAKYMRVCMQSTYIVQDFAINYESIKEYEAYFTPYHAVIVPEEPEKTKQTKLVNLVGFTKWSGSNASVSVSDGVISAIADGTGAFPVAYTYEKVNAENGKKYYCRVSVKVDSDKCLSILLRPLYSSNGTTFEITNVCKDHWYTFGWFVNVDTTGECTLPFNLYYKFASASDANGAVLSLKDILLFDISDFPHDVELYQLDRIPYFSGETEIHISDYLSTDIYGNESYELKNRIAFHNKQRKPIVTFLADDGFLGDFNKMHILSEKYGVPICSALPSTIHQMSIPQILYCQNVLGWEFGSHTYNHKALATLETEEEIDYQMWKSKEYMESHGIKCHALIYPEGSQDERVRRIAKRYFEMAFNTSPGVNNGVVASFDLNRYSLGSFYGEHGTYEDYKSRVDEAIEKNAWLIFMLHPANAQHDETQQEHFENIIKYIQQNNIPIVTMHEGYKYFGNALELGDYRVSPSQGKAISMDGQMANFN